MPILTGFIVTQATSERRDNVTSTIRKTSTSNPLLTSINCGHLCLKKLAQPLPRRRQSSSMLPSLYVFLFSFSLINNNLPSSVLSYRVTSKSSAKENSLKVFASLEQRNSPRQLRNASRPTAVPANLSPEPLSLASWS